MPVMAALEQSGAGDVLVIAGHPDHAVAGELFATEALRRGLAGIVIDGRCRDSRILAGLDLPVYARGVAPRAFPARSMPVIQVPLTIGGVEVRPGDILLGDDDGIVVGDDAELRRRSRRPRRSSSARGAAGAIRAVTPCSAMNFDEHVAELRAGRPSKLAFSDRSSMRPGVVGYANRMSRVQPSAIRELLRLGADPEIISFGGGYPDPALFPIEELHQVYARPAQRPTMRRLCSTRPRTGCRGCGPRSPSGSPAAACRAPPTTC